MRLELARLASSLLRGTRAMLFLNFLAFKNKKYTADDRFHGNGVYGKILTKKEPNESENSDFPCHIIIFISIYTLSDLGVLSNLISSLSLANEHYSPRTEWIMRKPNKNKMAGVNSRFSSVSESIFNGFLLKMLMRSLPVYILKQLFFSISVNSGRIFTSISKNNC